MGDRMKRLLHLNRSADGHRRLSSTIGVRLAGAALCTAGLAFIGFGTIGAPATKGLNLTSTPTCSTGTECIKASQVPTTGDTTGCTDIGNLVGTLDSTDSYWHFVVPAQQNWVFTGTTGSFTVALTGGSVESITFVQPTTGGFMGVVVVTDGGATLTNAFVSDSGTTESAELEGTGPEGDDFVLSSTCASSLTVTTSSTTSTVTTTTTTPTTTTTATTSTKSTTATVSTTVTTPTTTTKTTTETTSVPFTTTVTTGTTSTETTTVPTTVTTTTTSTGSTTKTVTNSTTLTVPTTLTAPTTVTTTKSVTVTAPASSLSSSSSTSSSTPTAAVHAATTPSTGSGSDLEFGVGLVLLVGGGGLIAGATRITRRKKS